MRWFAALLVACSLATAAVAVQPDEILDDPVLEARARALSAELRCMVCQNQSIDDSNAPLAHDLRLLVRERLVAGDTDAEVITYLVDRYGEFVLLRPRFSTRNWLLWAAPLLGLGIGAVVVIVALRQRRRGVAVPPPLSADEDRRLAEILGAESAARSGDTNRPV